MGRDMTLLSATGGTESLLRKTFAVLAGSLLIAVAAQFSVPIGPVPLSLQTLAILTIGLTFGSRLGAITLLAYLAEGAAGLPVFSNGGAGLAYMMGPTGGFLIGFVLTAWVAGLAAARGWTNSVVKTLPLALIAAVVLYIPGLIWPSIMLGTDWAALWSGWMAPFLTGDVIKAVLATLAVAGGWAVLSRR